MNGSKCMQWFRDGRKKEEAQKIFILVSWGTKGKFTLEMGSLKR